MDPERWPLEWIDEYVGRLRPYIFVREEDSLLIKVPNVAHKLNPSAVQILSRLLAGEPILDLWRSFGGTDEVRRDLYRFFCSLKQVLQGCIDENRLPKGVVKRPFALGFSTLPVLSEVALTYRCNLSCRFCYAGCSCSKRPDGDEMTTDEVRQVLRIIREDAQVPSVSFTGGEPTLRDDLPELVEYARHTLGLRVNLITNGTRIDPSAARKLAQAGLNSAQLSLESPSEQVHDRLTQSEGSHRRTLNGLQHLREEGIAVHTNTTLTRANRKSVLALPGYLRKLGLERFSMNLMIPTGTVGTIGESDLALTYSEASSSIAEIQNEARRIGIEFMWYSPTPLCIFNPIARGLGNKGCAACDGLLSVSPRGDVLPCSSWAEPVGNLLREPFRQVWNSARARWLRAKEFAPSACKGCEDFAACQAACPLYWDHFGESELDERRPAHVAARG